MMYETCMLTYLYKQRPLLKQPVEKEDFMAFISDFSLPKIMTITSN